MKKQRTDNFDKFANKQKGSAIKEQYRQEKKKEKAASRALGEELRQKKKDKMRGIETPPKEAAPQAARYGKRIPVAGASRPITKRADQGKAHTKPGARSQGKVQDASVQQEGGQLAANPTALMPLNKFIAHAGVCGRREAAELVKAGYVTVNGDKIFERVIK